MPRYCILNLGLLRRASSKRPQPSNVILETGAHGYSVVSRIGSLRDCVGTLLDGALLLWYRGASNATLSVHKNWVPDED